MIPARNQGTEQAPRRVTSREPPHIDGERPLDEVTEGDLVFCARPSNLQRLCDRAGEPWRHVGVATMSDGRLSIAEVSGARFGMRPLDEVIEANTVAIGRVPDDARPMAVEAARHCRSRCGEAQVYAWDDVILAGFIATTRRFCLAADSGALERAVDVATEALRARPVPAGGLGHTCSSFVVAAFADAGYPLDFDLHLPRAVDVRPSLLELVRGGPRPLRAGGGSRITGEQARFLVKSVVLGAFAGIAATLPTGSLDDAGRWATPGDLWRSNSLDERFLVQPRMDG